MTDGSTGTSVVRHLVDTVRSTGAASADPDDPQVRGFAEFGLPADSPLATDDQLRDLGAWRDNLHIPANSAFLDGTLLLTVEALLGSVGQYALTPVTLWELTTFIDALVCFDRLYCIANPVIDASAFNRRLGSDVLTVIPDPEGGTLRRLAAQVAVHGLSDMEVLRGKVGSEDAFGQEVQAVVNGWRAVLGPDFPTDGPFDTDRLSIQNIMLARSTAEATLADTPAASAPLFDSGPDMSAATPEDQPGSSWSAATPEDQPSPSLSAVFIGDAPPASGEGAALVRSDQLQVLIRATRLERTPADPTDRPPLEDRQRLAAAATYRTYVNQGIANALALPYLPGTLRMPFRHLFVERAREIQDELVSVALADQIFARHQPSSPLTLPLFTSAVLQGAATRQDIWAQMARVREQSAPFRRKRTELDWMLERSQVSPEALQVQSAMNDEALKLADVAGAGQQALSVILGVMAQAGIVPLAGGALKTAVDAAQGIGREGSWTRIWRRLFHRDQYVLTQAHSQAVALTNALPQIRELWQMPNIGGYLDRFASATQQAGNKLRTPDIGA